jgi:hypothetical protein
MGLLQGAKPDQKVLQRLVLQVAEICPIVKESLESGKLLARDSGQGSPCLDLARLNFEVFLFSVFYNFHKRNK